jgi:KDO2-lipid IV(A) lauroyltransferase
VGSLKLRAFRGRFLRRILDGVRAIVERLPLRAARFLGARIGALGWLVLWRERRRAMENLAAAFPDWPPERRRATIRAMFRHLGMTLMEVLWLPRNRAEGEALTTIENIEPMLAHVRAGRGVIAFTAHCGNWEWLAWSVTTRSKPVYVLQRERDEATLNDFLDELRSGITTISRGSAAAGRDLIRCLRGAGILGILLDQNIRAESVKVPFFGRPALTPIGPAQLAIRTGCVVVCGFIERRDGRQIVRFNEPRIVCKDEDAAALTAEVTAQIEAQIRAVPEQWVWMHQRWKERPKWETQRSEPRIP